MSTRREFVGTAFALATTMAACGAPDQAEQLPRVPDAALSPVEAAAGLLVHPRADWGADLPPKAAMGPEDARFLLIHHTGSNVGLADPRGVIRSVYAFHTGRQKRWRDVAYNFFVGPDGSVWEGRAGSLAGPIVADATGGNQGFSQLICLLGDFTSVEPTPAAQQSLVKLLAFLAVRDGLSTWKGAAATFTSRGSDRWRAGSLVTTPTISGHRDMSYTVCPGKLAYALLPTWRAQTHPLAAASWQRDGAQRAERLALEAP